MTTTGPATPARSDPAVGRPELPTTRAEDWRYAPLKAITAAADAATGTARTSTGEELDTLLASLPAGPRVVLVDGRLAPDLTSATTAGPAIEPDVDPLDATPAARDGFEEWNRRSTPSVLRIHADDTHGAGDGFLHLVHLSTQASGPSHPRVDVVVDGHHPLRLVESFQAVPGATFTNATTTIHAGIDSRVDHLVVLDTPADGAHVVRTTIVAGDRAHVTAGVVDLGAGSGHHRLSVALDGPGAEVSLTGLNVSSSGAHHDTLAAVHHLASHGTSRQMFASIVADRARASFTGQVVVAHGTTGTDADQQNRNLLLGPAARADTRPWLEIHSDEVACTHGATIGRLDDDGVFYLRSRGIAERDARTMLMRAFATTIIDALTSDDEVRSWIDASVTAELDAIVQSDIDRSDP